MCPFNQPQPSSISSTTISHWIMSACCGIFDLFPCFDLWGHISRPFWDVSLITHWLRPRETSLIVCFPAEAASCWLRMLKWSESKVNTGGQWDGLEQTEGPKTISDTDILNIKCFYVISASRNYADYSICVRYPVKLILKGWKSTGTSVYLSLSTLQNQFCRSCDQCIIPHVYFEGFFYLLI